MKASELRQLSEEELADKLAEAHKEVFKLRFQLRTSQLENTARIRQVSREIARIKTLMTERAKTRQAEL